MSTSSAREATTSETRTSTGMQRMLLVASLLVFIVGIQLFIFSEQTATFFAWTIQVPLTAAFLGAAYWSSFLLEFLASRERLWARARIAIPAVLVFTGLSFIVTMIHLDKFHLGNAYDFLTQAVTWVWILVYLSVPVIMSILLVQQLRRGGTEPTRRHPLPMWVRIVFAIYAVIMLPLGLGLLILPTTFAAVWPWALTALTGRAIGAWLIGLGIAAAQVVIENDWTRVAAGMAGFAIFGGLELIALLRYSGNLNGNAVNNVIYIVLLVGSLLIGVYGWLTARRAIQNEPT